MRPASSTERVWRCESDCRGVAPWGATPQGISAVKPRRLPGKHPSMRLVLTDRAEAGWTISAPARARPMNPAGRVSLRPGTYRNSARHCTWWLRVAVATGRVSGLSPRIAQSWARSMQASRMRASSSAYSWSGATWGLAALAPVAFVIGTAACRTAGGATEHELNKLQVHVRHHEADQLRPDLRRNPPLAGLLRHPPVSFLPRLRSRAGSFG